MTHPRRSSPPHVAIVGAGLAGASCAAGLRRHGWRVTVFDKSRGVGGRMATRRTEVDGHALAFDHGAPCVAPRDPRFRALWAEAVAAGDAARWRPRVYADLPGLFDGTLFVARPGMPALVRRLLEDATLALGRTVTSIQADDGGWWVQADGAPAVGPFDQVVLAMPPRQAAALLTESRPDWAAALEAQRMVPTWTLMAATDEVDWPWDVAEPSRGPLAWVMRNDRRPGRTAPDGWATWVAHATPSWSLAHLEEDPADVAAVLRDALRALLPPARKGGPALRWHHVAAHRWRYALPMAGAGGTGAGGATTGAVTGAVTGSVLDSAPCWWDAGQALGVCGDALGGSGAEGAWRSGDALAQLMLSAGTPARAPRRGVALA